ncbi:DNA polymerase, partial [Bienertia sinuspersici]
MRNHRLDQVVVYYKKRMLFRFRDSLNLLLSSLNSLAKNLCPELGNKGSLDHNSINLWNLAEKREEVDIEKWMTVASLALGIYQIKGYYGGHTNAYIPRGENQFYYDVNSLYPYVMKEYPMPGGKPVRHSNLS